MKRLSKKLRDLYQFYLFQEPGKKIIISTIMSDPDLHVVFSFNRPYLQAAAITIRSLLQQSEQPHRYHLWIMTDEDLEEEITQELRQWQVSYTMLPLPPEAYRYAEAFPEVISPYQMARLCLHRVLPDEVKIVLSLDTDLIVLSQLEDLFDIHLTDSGWAAVPEEVLAVWGFHGDYSLVREEVSPKTPYYNCGVFLANLEYWRETDFDEQVEELVATYAGKLVYVEQDILNLIFKDATLPLPLTYNRPVTPWSGIEWYPGTFPKVDQEASFDTASILHFSDWKPLSTGSSRIWQLYKQYAKNIGIPEQHPGLQEAVTETRRPLLPQIFFTPLHVPLHRIWKAYTYRLPIAHLFQLLLKRVLLRPYLLFSYPLFLSMYLLKKALRHTCT